MDLGSSEASSEAFFGGDKFLLSVRLRVLRGCGRCRSWPRRRPRAPIIPEREIAQALKFGRLKKPLRMTDGYFATVRFLAFD
jgi:hypothetical protein